MIPVALALIAFAHPPARVQVSAQEFSFTLSRASIEAGPAIVELANFGEDPHDLRMRRVGGRMIGEFPGIGPGRLDNLGNVQSTADFRGVYAALIEQWLGADANAIIPNAVSLPRPTLLK